MCAGTGEESGKAAGQSRPWFRRESRPGPGLPGPPGDVEWFVPALPVPSDPEAARAFADMTRELVDYRLAQYRARSRQDSSPESFEAKVLTNKRDPILKLPSVETRPDVPRGDFDVHLPNGSMWTFRLMKEFCNVAFPAGPGPKLNQLPDLLHRWFGPTAGHPGTKRFVRFTRSPDGWWAKPDEVVVADGPSGMVVAFPSLQAAAGAAGTGVELTPNAEHVRLPVKGRGTGQEGRDLFTVRASGDSMERPGVGAITGAGAGTEAGPRSIRHGDWLVMRYARSAGLESLEGRIALMQVPDTAAGFGFAYQVKRIVRDGRRWMLRSDNPERSSFEATAEMVPIALLAEVVPPESLAPRPGERLAEGEVGKAFGLSEEPRGGRAERVEGHLFLMVEERRFVAPDRVKWDVEGRRPGETAFALARGPGEGSWRYVGVGRWLEQEGTWDCPELDFATWRAVGSGRGASRRLPEEYREEARNLVQRFLEHHGAGAEITLEGKSLRIVGEASQGGLRIDGGEAGFGERTISLMDLAWVLKARELVEGSGGVLDEARVNSVRYLDGTPRGATRWVDTAWALMLFRAVPTE